MKLQDALRLIAAIALVAVLAAWRYSDLPMVRCAWCGTAGTLLNGLNRHHIIPQETAPELADDPGNLIVLCRRDHLVLGHRGSWHKYNPDVAEICQRYTNCLPNVRRATTNETSVAQPVRL